MILKIPDISTRLILLIVCLLHITQARLFAMGPPENAPAPENFEIGQPGGTLFFAQTEPKTLNPLLAMETSSKTIIGLLNGDLLHINNRSQQTEPGAADRWSVSSDGKHYRLHLRKNLRFSDGAPCQVEDVIFSFETYLNEEMNAPQRNLFIIAGKPMVVRKIDAETIGFDLPQPYAAAERLFDGVAILPRHLLQGEIAKGMAAQMWGLATTPQRVAGLGPFRLKKYIPGERLILERNPYYWKRDKRGKPLPYLDEIVAIFTGTSNAETLQFQAGETDVLNRISASDFAVLERDQRNRRYRLVDLGPGLEFEFLFFNQNALHADPRLLSISRRQKWFNQTAFRQAVSSAIDRESIIRLAFLGRAYPLVTSETPSNSRWVNREIPRPVRSLEHARQLLRKSGFTWNSAGRLQDASGEPVGFALSFNAGKQAQVQTATLIQQDLKDLGIKVDLDGLESRTFMQKILTTFRYEAALLTLAGADTDPNAAMEFLASGGNVHFWTLKAEAARLPAWQLEIDTLMQKQLIELDYEKRKQLYDRAQRLVWENMPVICLLSPHILVGAKDRIGNFRPGILGNYCLWNADQLFLRR